MADTRHRDTNWNVGETVTMDGATLAVLMDIRDRLDVLLCPSFRQIPVTLLRIEAELAKLNRELKSRRKPRT